jgi:hypothetical protein
VSAASSGSRPRSLRPTLTRSRNDDGRWLRYAHGTLAIAWLAMVPVALATGWVSSLIFISACSIYANAVGHFSAWQAARAEREAQ